MASVSATSLRLRTSLKQPLGSSSVEGRGSIVKLASVGLTKGFPSLKSSSFCVQCAEAIGIAPESELTPESKFSALGADSLDTVEIVMNLEEEFGIAVEEDDSQNITTVQEAADMIEKLVQEKSSSENTKSSHLWRSDAHNSSNQSPWLQSTLSDFDEKTKAILALVQQEGDSFAERAEMYYKSRPQVIKMVEDLNRSYVCLAERYDHQIRSQASFRTITGSSSSSNSFRHASKRFSTSYGDSELDGHYSRRASIDEIVDCNTSCKGKFDDERQISLDNMRVLMNKKIGYEGGRRSLDGEDHKAFGSAEKERIWSQMRCQVAKLMEDNLRQQTELIRRNDEKREAIKELCLQLDKVVDENKRLQKSLQCSKTYCEATNQSQISKLKSMILNKLLGGGSCR
ncbi:hypothetical protein Scep_018288 [Stephania cephalantha]|uniref:Acyl carrier protein n=1 Tax=Stephania cephalantha TaxID=152367 RepID=A0AAP0IS53_9MAGN